MIYDIVQLTIFIVIYIVFYKKIKFLSLELNFLKKTQEEINKTQEEINKNLVPTIDQVIKQPREDIKTLYDNQKMLLSLINAVRGRINNFYAKKHKDAKLRRTSFKRNIEGDEA